MLLSFGQRRAPRLRPNASEQAILRVYNERDLRKAIGALCAYSYQAPNVPRYEIVVAADIGISDPIEAESGIGDGPGDLVIRSEGSARLIPTEDLDYLFRVSGTQQRNFTLRELNIGAPEDSSSPEFGHVFSTTGSVIATVERCRIATATGLFTATSAAPTVQYSLIRDNMFLGAASWQLLSTIGMRFSLVQGNRAAASWDIVFGTAASVYNSIVGNHMRAGAITTTGSSGNNAISGNTQATITTVGSDSAAGNT